MSRRNGPDPALHTLLGPGGRDALNRATRALEEHVSNPRLAPLRLAGWTARGWSFRFELPAHGRALVVHVPHDGGPTEVGTADGGPDPLAPGGPQIS